MITKILIKAKYLQSGDRNKLKCNQTIDDKNEVVECRCWYLRGEIRVSIPIQHRNRFIQSSNLKLLD